MSVLSLKNFSLFAAGNRLLNSVNLDIEKHDFIKITSDQQGGKSSLMNAIAGFSSSGLVNYQGEVYFQQKLIDNHCKNRELLCSDIVIISEQDQSISRMNLLDNILLPFKYHDITYSSNKFDYLLDVFDLTHEVIQLMPEEVNDVITMRCLIVRSLLLTPKLLLLDEIEGGMNQKEFTQALEVIYDQCQLNNCAILMTTTRIEGDLHTKAFNIQDNKLLEVIN